MSAWDKPAARATLIPIKGRKKNANQKITPYVVLTQNHEAFEQDLERLRTNNGQYRASISHLLSEDLGDIKEVVPVARSNGAIAYLQ